jgi:RNA polymerase sigma factor for flagellar operon FliA
MPPTLDLVHQGLPVVQAVSRRIARRLGGTVPIDDLAGIGNLALVEVARSYDPSQASFPAYAATKLRWAILDGLRRETHARNVSVRAVALLASERLSEAWADEQAASDEPTTIEQDQEALADLLGAHAAALALGLTAGPPDPELVNLIGQTPEEALSRAQTVERIHAAVSALPDRERALIERHYWGGDQFDAIAKDLGISKSRASHLHKDAIVTLADAMRDP